MTIVESGGVRLVADERGEGEAIVFVCGTGMPAVMWEMYGRSAFDQSGFRTIAYDNRGIAPSDAPPPPYAMQDLADDAIAVITSLANGRCHLVGTSLGANIVATVARQRPDLVRSAICFVGGGNFRSDLTDRLADDVALYSKGGGEAREAQLNGLLDALLTPSQRADPAAIAAATEMVAPMQNANEDWSGAIGQAAANAEWGGRDHLDEAAEISVPCLFLASELDAFFDPEDLRATADRVPSAEFVLLEGQPHVVTDPAHVARVIQTSVEFVVKHRGT